ncbi:MAG: lysine--tRNA ligase [Pyrinomonadaceae bacterium]
MDVADLSEIIEPNDQTAARQEHLDELCALVGNAYPNKFDRTSMSGAEDTITKILQSAPIVAIVDEVKAVVATLAERERPPAEIKDRLNAELREFGNVRVAGRLTTPPRGNFVHLTDGLNKLQIYCKKGTFALVRNDAENSLDEENGWTAFGLLDHGDFVGVEGYLFITNTGELSVHVERLQFLVKAMVPMPDKMHGITDPEIRQRQRYVDLIGSSLQVEHEGLTTRQVFEMRARTISAIRRFLEDHGYVEVETPMLTPKATGAAATPFETHHNALDIKLYARIAPELYLKRLLVGGFEKVYELNRNFRNEGISYKHNPEFTMLEFYCAYMDVEGMMDLCEELLKDSVQRATGGLSVNYEGKEIDFSKFERITMRDAVARKSEPGAVATGFPPGDEKNPVATAPGSDLSDGELLAAFEEYVERNLIRPTFVIDFPKSISPLSKASPADPSVAERFELFVNGMEIANGFSELNDPKEQYDRFIEQMSERERGDEEAMVLDEDYIRALSYGMPPAAGIGMGIDRLMMLLTNKHSIRDVILFPHMRPERE